MPTSGRAVVFCIYCRARLDQRHTSIAVDYPLCAFDIGVTVFATKAEALAQVRAYEKCGDLLEGFIKRAVL